MGEFITTPPFVAVRSLGEASGVLVTHLFPWTPQPLTTTGKSCFNFCNTCSHLRSTSSALINNRTGLIWSKLSLYGQLGWGSIRSLSIVLLRFFPPIYLVGNHFTCVGLFLHLLGTRNQSECGKQKSWWFINISGPINNTFNFIQKGIGNFAQFGALEWSQSRSAKAKPPVDDGARCSRCPLLPPSPSYNATPPATEGCRATRVSRDLFASPALTVAKGPAGVAGQREHAISASLRDFGPKLLPFCPHPTYRWL